VGQPAFSFVHWYMDCVTDAGNALILDCVEMRWRGVFAVHSNVLTLHGGETASQSTMARYHVYIKGGQLIVDIPRLDLSGRWEATAAPFKRTVFQGPQGSVIRDCVQPRSTVHVRAMGSEFTGLGYAHRIVLTAPPWQLPIQSLHRGRFVSGANSLAWVDWRGPHSTRYAVHNGVECEPVSVSDSEIVLPHAALCMENSRILRSGTLGSNYLPGAPTLGKLLPQAFLAIGQEQSLSYGDLNGKDLPTGWVIQETLSWKS